MLEAEVIEALLYGCVTRIPNKPERTTGYGTFTTTCATDVSGSRDVSDHTLSYVNASAKTDALRTWR